jgi:nucleoside-diphosphate-sugar epimerase
VKQALIVGAGYVGGVVAERLTAAGWRVWTLTRTRECAAPIRSLHADVSQPASLDTAMQRAGFGAALDAVVYAVSAAERSDAAYRTAYVTGVAAVLHALSPFDVARWILVSSTGVYPQCDGAWLDESSPAEPTHFSGRRLRESEQLVLAADAAASIVRLAGIYGPGRSRLRDMVEDGRGFAHLDAPRYQNRIHRDDAAGFITHLASMTTERERMYIGVDDEPADLRDVQAWFCERIAVDPTALSAPSRGYSHPGKRCRNQAMKRSGYQLRYPSYREGYAALGSPPRG